MSLNSPADWWNQPVALLNPDFSTMPECQLMADFVTPSSFTSDYKSSRSICNIQQLMALMKLWKTDSESTIYM